MFILMTVCHLFGCSFVCCYAILTLAVTCFFNSHEKYKSSVRPDRSDMLAFACSFSNLSLTFFILDIRISPLKQIPLSIEIQDNKIQRLING